jgi:hypothetical protein
VLFKYLIGVAIMNPENEEDRATKHKIKDIEGAFGDDSDEWEQIEKELYQDRLKPSLRKEITFE